MGDSVTFDLFARDRASQAFSKVGKAADDSGKKVHGLNAAFGAVSAGSRGLHTSFGLIGKGAALAAGAAGLGGLIEGFKGVYAEAREAQKTSAQTNAVIKSTGGIAKVTAGHVGDLATAISNKVGVDDEAIQSGANLLLTFTKVRNEAGKGNQVFDEATKTVTDMAAAMNNGEVTTSGLKTASIQVGKALNDPIKGMTALAKVGVTFDEGQKKQIATLIKHHDQLGAQKVILGELNKEFGGSAAAGTTAGQKLGVVFGNIKETIGTALLPTIDNVANWFSKTLPVALAIGERWFGRIKTGAQGLFDFIVKGDFTGNFAKAFHVSEDSSVVDAMFNIRDAITKAADWVKTTGVPAVVGAFGDLKTKLGAELGKIDLSGIRDAFMTQATTWGGALIDGVKTGLGTGDWSGLGQTVGNGIIVAISGASNLIGKIGAKISELFSKVDWVGIGIAVGKQVPSLLVGLAAGILNFDLMGLLKGLARHWQDVLLAVIAVAFAPARVIGKVGEVLARIPFVGKLLEWALLAFKRFSDRLVGMVFDSIKFMGRAFLEGFRRVFPDVGSAFGRELAILPTRLGVVALDVIAGAKRMMRGLADAISRGIAGVIANIGELIARMLKPFTGAGGWLIRRGIEFVSGLIRGVGSMIGSAAAMASRIGLAIVRPFAGAGGWLLRAGGDLIRGLLGGARGALSAVGQWARDIGSSIVGAVKSFFGIHSPSTVFAGLGSHLMSGLMVGMLKHNPVAMVGKVFGGMTGALRHLFSKGIISATANLGGKALSALGGLAGNVFGGGGKSSNAGNESIVKGMASQFFGWSGSEWTALRALIMGESGFNNTAQNPSSSAYGMGQFLDSTWGGVGIQKTSNASVQSLGLLRYIKQSYGDPINAFSSWLNRSPHWYGSGTMGPTVFDRPTLIGVGERGPETVSVIPHGRGGGSGDVYHIHLSGVVGDKQAVIGWVQQGLRETQRKAGKPVTI